VGTIDPCYDRRRNVHDIAVLGHSGRRRQRQDRRPAHRRISRRLPATRGDTTLATPVRGWPEVSCCISFPPASCIPCHLHHGKRGGRRSAGALPEIDELARMGVRRRRPAPHQAEGAPDPGRTIRSWTSCPQAAARRAEDRHDLARHRTGSTRTDRRRGSVCATLLAIATRWPTTCVRTSARATASSRRRRADWKPVYRAVARLRGTDAAVVGDVSLFLSRTIAGRSA